MRTLGQELDITKVLNEQERELNNAEKEFYASVKLALSEAINGVGELRNAVMNEIIIPLETEYGKNRDASIKNFLLHIAKFIGNYNMSVDRARTQFILGFGRDVYEKNYKGFFDVLVIRYVPKYPEITKPYIPVLSHFGVIPAVVISVGTTIGKMVIWQNIANRLMNVPVIRDTLTRIIEALYHIWSELYFIIKPYERTRRKNLENKARYLKKASKFVENAFNILITAIQTLQTNIERKLNAFITQTEKAEEIAVSQAERQVYVPYTVLPKPLKREILLPSGGRAVTIEYKREYAPKSITPAFGDFIDGEGKFSILQYATGILIPKERFPYE